jgi:hypothetical protein
MHNFILIMTIFHYLKIKHSYFQIENAYLSLILYVYLTILIFV